MKIRIGESGSTAASRFFALCRRRSDNVTTRAGVDMNVAYTRGGKFVEIQGSAENAGGGFDRRATQEMLDLAVSGCEQLMAIQREAIGTR